MEVILLQKIENLGDLGEKVKVKPGYARNHLIPKSLAKYATEENLKEWFEAGVHCVGIGSKLFLKNADGSFGLEKVEAKVSEAIQIVESFHCVS